MNTYRLTWATDYGGENLPTMVHADSYEYTRIEGCSALQFIKDEKIVYTFFLIPNWVSLEA